MAARPKQKPADQPGLKEIDAHLLKSAYAGIFDLVKAALEQGADIKAAEPRDGLTALHIAVGTNNLPLARYLVEEWHAPFVTDGFGRFPTAVAAECGASDELCDYIVEQEAKALGITE